MSVTSRTQRMSAAERREQLLDVTKELVGEHGFHGVTMEAVARRAGITRPIVYGHFHDLRGLLQALLDRETERALAQLSEILGDDLIAAESRTEALLAATRGYLEAVRADPVTWRLILMPPEGAPEVLREHIARGREAVLAVLADVVRPGSGGPGLASPDPPLTARMLSALADEAARLLLTEPDEYPLERLLEHSRWLLERLAAPAG
ncbi:MAG: TetR/AcrR family transcriptional regulator [Actinobacteria bacterium]|nr:MAG: TetR/AcrR family transcriptional regulator [Actinomycetota bacterium]